MSTVDHEVWLEKRKKGLGGSDTPVVILGKKHPFSNPVELWKEKRGLAESKPATPAMLRGAMLEKVAAELYMTRTGRKTRRINKHLRHKQYDWMLGNIDREIVGKHPNDGPGVLEVKCPGLRVFAKCKREGCPDYYQLQIQHYLAVTGREWGALAIFSAELWELVYFDVERDEDIIGHIYEKDAEFWRLVVDGIQPPDDTGTDMLPELPAIQGDVTFARIETDEFEQAVRDYWEARNIVAEASELQESAEERIQNFMSLYEAVVAENGNSRFYWKPREGRKRLDKAAFRKAHPEIDLEEFYKPGKPSRPFRAFQLKEAAINE
jgi:putative phage-type endonuclease